jgi:hypothetical protein
VSSHRARLPRWRQIDYDPWEDFPGPIESLIFAPLIILVLVLLAVPIYIVELPVALVRSAFSRTRYVQAECGWPAEIRITWRTDREHVAAVEEAVARGLERGYEQLNIPHAERIEMTPPPGLEDT